MCASISKKITNNIQEISAINWTAAPSVQGVGWWIRSAAVQEGNTRGINLKRCDLDRWPLIKVISEIWREKMKLLEDNKNGTVILN